MSPHRSRIRGVSAALRLPLLMRGDAFARLLVPASGPRDRGIEPETAIRSALLTLRLLARLRLRPWRNTCLYRSVLRCVLLREGGRAATLRIGATRGRDVADAVRAHAWVEVDGEPIPDEALPYTPLEAAPRGQ